MHATFSSPFKNILDTIGHTPLVEFSRLFPQADFKVYGKLESFNPGGSIKDRTALRIIAHALETGDLKPGDTVIESSSGNMAIGLAQVCLFYGLKLIVVVDPKINAQNLKLLRAYGAEIVMVEKPAGDKDYLQERLDRVSELLQIIPNGFWPDQYANPDSPAAQWSTMEEIAGALNGDIDYLFISTSTCGTLMGCAEYLDRVGNPAKIVAVDALGSVIFGTPSGERLIPGHGAGRPSQFLDPAAVADVIQVSDEECVQGCRKLMDREAICCGGSSGGIVSAVEQYSHRIESGANCVMLLCDRGDRYLDTIYNEEWVKRNIRDHQSILAE